MAKKKKEELLLLYGDGDVAEKTAGRPREPERRVPQHSARRAMQAPPDAYICPITSEMMSDPVSTSDGFTYEREAILEWLRSGNTTSPLSGAVLERSDLVPNHGAHSPCHHSILSVKDACSRCGPRLPLSPPHAPPSPSQRCGLPSSSLLRPTRRSRASSTRRNPPRPASPRSSPTEARAVSGRHWPNRQCRG